MIVNYLISFFCYWLLALGLWQPPPLFMRLRVCARNEALWGICQKPEAKSQKLHSIHYLLKSAVIIPEVHLHLFYAGFAFVV